MTALPKLERLLLDTDLDVEIQPYLEALGFQTKFALNISADHRSDVDLLRWARMNDYILVCHDKHKDKSTRLELFPELKTHGGRILRITGDSSQSVLTALGKILVNREKWRSWFADHDGLVILKMDGVIYRTAEELYSWIESDLEDADPAARIRDRRPTQSTSRTLPTPPQRNRLFD
ncbi:MAG: hypothetical protein F4Y49_15525 [Dehalococcoidia bacterium]|nr:hypothetical protein [Dehalococcoidia bacterium]